MVRYLFLLVSFIGISFSFSQKKMLDQNAYGEWRKIEKAKISCDGNWVSYEITPLKGNAFLFWYNKSSDKLDSMDRSNDIQMAADASFFAWKLHPDFDSLRNLELKKIDKKKWPKDSLVIFNSLNASMLKFPDLKSFQVAPKGNVLAYLSEKNESNPSKKEEEKKSKCCFKKNETPLIKKDPKSDGTKLVLRNVDSVFFQAPFVTLFALSPHGNQMAFVTHEKGKIDTFNLQIFQTYKDSLFPIIKHCTSIKNMVWDANDNFLAFMYSKDTCKVKQFHLGLFEMKSLNFTTYGDSSSMKSFDYLGINDNAIPEFFDFIPFVKIVLSTRAKNELDTLLETEKVRLDLWHYQDAHLQSQQLVELKETLKRGTSIGLNLLTRELILWAPDSLEFSKNIHELGHYGLIYNENPYAIESQWRAPSLRDVIRVDLNTGVHKLIQNKNAYGGILAVSGKEFAYFDTKSKEHYLMEIDNENKAPICMSCSSKESFDVDLNGQPMDAGPIASYGFNKKGSKYFFASRDNVYCFNIAEQNLQCISCSWNPNNNIEWSMHKWINDTITVALKNVYFKGINKETKEEYIRLSMDSMQTSSFISGNFKVMSLLRSENTKTILLRKMTVDIYPELELFSDNAFKTISHTNSQQKDYNWATVDLLKWQSYKGMKLEGLLYKPEDYDPNKKYPLLVYFYELNGDNLHVHRAPAPSASTINPIEYASRGYLVFIPDIRYVSGYPAKSAYDCIMSGTDLILKKYAIDSLRMGLQGQSWGGYQAAQLITMTSRYKAAMAGAPVSNMFSAYGGIRWGSGMNRQFQYESTQSRIGATIWDRPDLYIENSPMFHLPKVTTPLLIMANDKDGAVPWYQGIELYNGLRRLNKPCWLLNYNDDDHNLTKLPNKLDLSIRMRQFFDYYLQDGPLPLWLKEGIDATEKGKNFKYTSAE